MNTFVRILEPVQTALKRGEPSPKHADVALDDTANLDRLTHVIALANAHTARVVGVTAGWSGVGVTATSCQLATAYARFGKKVLLVDASEFGGTRADDKEREAEKGATAERSLVERSTETHSGIRYAAVGTESPAQSGGKGLRDLLRSAADEGYAVIVDLPPVLGGEQGALASFAERGGACDIVVLVCMSGEMTQKELKRCVTTCEVAGVKLGGLILNDWKLPAAALLET